MKAEDPLRLFKHWFAEAREKESSDPTAMALATASLQGKPTVRMVLLKQADADGFVFYTNLKSPKASDLDTNPQASLCLNWPVLQRQIRIDGTVKPVSPAEADAYFATRPWLSKIGAWASRQSQTMAGRYELVQAVAAVSLRFGTKTVPRPSFWSGYRVIPDSMEFWQQRPFRQHDRQRFTRVETTWSQEWLFP